MSSSHSRTASEETNSTSMSYILEHVLQYPGSYEIPLRTMYTLNCVPRAQPLPKELSRSPTPSDNRSGSPVSVSGQMAWNDAEATTMNFTSQLMSHLNSLPTHQSSLPPAFIISFVNRCFHPSLSLVDFPQALTALDYLRDLENRRHMEMIAALERLHIHKDTYAADMDSMAEQFPGIALWIKNIEGKDKKAQHNYAQLWLGLRRWVLINELSLQPFSKLNCVGMLNTLLPPMHPDGKTPSPLLPYQTLRDERETFFDYIRHVQKEGPSVLQPIIELHKAPGDENGWPMVQKVVDKYLRVAKNMIDDCQSITGPESFNRATEEPRKGKKTDSGVSFGSERSQSVGALNTLDNPMPEQLSEPMPAPKSLSRLERITREFRRMRVKTRPDVEEIVKIDQQPDTFFVPPTGQNKGKTIKKARSMANLGNARNAHIGSSPLLPGSRNASDAVPFDAEQMKRHRKMYEASVRKGAKNVI